MIFADVPLADAEGAVLAHSVQLDDGRLSKGRRLDGEDLSRLASAGIATVTVARLEPGDLSEDAAAARVGAAVEGAGLRLGPVFTGRVNLIADAPGIVSVDASKVTAFNAIHEGLTLATVPHLSRIAEDQLVATAKIIPYGLPANVVETGLAALGQGALQLHPFGTGKAHLIMTRTPGFKDSLLDKGSEVVGTRIAALGLELAHVTTVPHEADAVAAALKAKAVDLALILGASATSDRRDVAPRAVVQAGGEVDRFGMPVDPGNLLFLGRLGDMPVVGLPGCARSPALNGVDWVLERLAAGLTVTDADFAAMGVGGLLKEMVGRPQPRRPQPKK